VLKNRPIPLDAPVMTADSHKTIRASSPVPKFEGASASAIARWRVPRCLRGSFELPRSLDGPHRELGSFSSLQNLAGPVRIEWIQTGARIEKRLLKVLKGLAELKDLSLGDLLEGIVFACIRRQSGVFEGDSPAEIAELKKIYGVPMGSSDSHNLKEK